MFEYLFKILLITKPFNIIGNEIAFVFLPNYSLQKSPNHFRNIEIL